MTLDLFYFKNNQYISYNIVNCAIFEESYEQKIKPFALTDDEPKAESDDNSNPTTKG